MGRDSSIYHGFEAHLLEYCDRTGREYQGLGVGTIKKFATGTPSSSGSSGHFKLPLVILTLVPLTRIGIMLGHWMFGAPFTATLMIGFIALAGHHRPKTDTPFFIRFPNSPAIRITNASSINY